ncbi:MBL fold metallo-hydrolase [Actinophytocola sp.]|uniref:MBL fold metallo-hydrolase n=1 Tax=Actinophytocola sp. TaxID=1872138 RepID=UPI003D6A0B1D
MGRGCWPSRDTRPAASPCTCRHRILFTGDTIARSPAGEVILGVFNQDEDRQLAAFRRLAELDVETACFGHGDPLVTDAGAALREAVANHRPRDPVA